MSAILQIAIGKATRLLRDANEYAARGETTHAVGAIALARLTLTEAIRETLHANEDHDKEARG